MPNLTPYDTGERLEPKLWVTSTAGLTRDNADEFGKVDFDDEEGATAFTVRAERNPDGSYTLRVENISVELYITREWAPSEVKTT